MTWHRFSSVGHIRGRKRGRQSLAGVPEERQFRINEAYDDEEWQRLLAATCEVLDITQEQAEQAYADFFCKDAQQRWPRWFQMSENGRQFLERAAHHP